MSADRSVATNLARAPQAPPALADIPGVWRGAMHQRQPALPTGHAPLDRSLPGGGWPLDALSELLTDQPGLGLELLLPALRAHTRAGRSVALVAPPHIPCAAGLQQAGVDLAHLLWVRSARAVDALWAAEQLARSGVVPLVAAWSPRADDAELRRLQLATAGMGGILVLLRPAAAAQTASPAALRLLVQTQTGGGLHLRLLKNRGGRSGLALELPRAA